MNPLDCIPDSYEDVPGGGGDFELIPKGWYAATVQRAEAKQSAAGGTYVAVGFELENNRWVFNNYNLKHPNEKAVEIGLRDWGTLSKAVGAQAPVKNLDFLLGKRLMVRVKHKRNRESDEMESAVGSVKPLDGANPPAPKRAAAAPAAPKPAAQRSNPWGDQA